PFFGAGEVDRLTRIRRMRRAMRDVEISARARARIAENHERRGAVVPALADVGAVGFLANSVQVQPAHQPLQSMIVLRAGRPDLQPLGLWLPGCLVGARSAAADERKRGRGHAGGTGRRAKTHYT